MQNDKWIIFVSVEQFLIYGDPQFENGKICPRIAFSQKGQQPPEGLFPICALSVDTIQNLNKDLGDSLSLLDRFTS